jgi:hypothetical protein
MEIRMPLLIIAGILGFGLTLWRPRARENGARRDGLLLLAGLLFVGALVSFGLRQTKWHLYGEEGIVLGITLAVLFVYIAIVYPRWLLPRKEPGRGASFAERAADRRGGLHLQVPDAALSARRSGRQSAARCARL